MAKKSTETATKVSKEIKGRGKYTRTNKCMKQTTEKSLESGKHTRFPNGREKYSPCNRSAESPSPQDRRLVAPLDLHTSKEVRPSQKMTLQLFPLDAHTREGLEKNGFHPYLELTLSSRKKISSVLQHIHNKWGSSEIAQGDPILYPYDKLVLAAGYKWTANSNITTSDIYAAIGSPALFRLRYGWSSATDNKTSPSPPGISCFQHEEPTNKAECVGFTGNQMISIDTLPSSPKEVTDPPHSENVPPDDPVQSTENKTDVVPGSTLIFWDDGLTSLSIGGLLSEASMKGSFANRFKNANASTTLWDDGLTNMSIGSLFNDASLQDKRKRNTNQEQESNHSNKITIRELISEAASDSKKGVIKQQQPSRLISDSLDAFLVSRTNQLQAQCPPISEQPHSSILDAEDTCHAFSFRKGTITSLKVPNQVSGEAEREQERDESKHAKSLFGSVGFNMDSSLGFSGIKWGADSRGPFDLLGFSSSTKFSNVDSVSLSDVVKDLQETTEPLEDYQKIQK